MARLVYGSVMKKIFIFLIAWFVIFVLLGIIITVVCYNIDFDPYKINFWIKVAWLFLAVFGAQKVAEKFSKTKKNYSTVTSNHSK